MAAPPDALLAVLLELGGAGLEVVELAEARTWAAGAAPGVVRLGVHRAGPRPPVDVLDRFDLLLSQDLDAPRPWVGLGEGLDGGVARLREAVALQPAAATVAAQVLRMSLQLDFDHALVLESLAYSMLLGGEAFRAWRSATPRRDRDDSHERRVSITRDDEGAIAIRLTRPAARNAVDAAMRDALAEALQFAVEDPDQAPVVLSGEGPSFCAGGDLDEFGQADDPARAHLIRLLRAPARQLRALGERVTVRVHGACIGAGIELPAAAGRVVARPDARFRLPELAMGLIPGAGGTATLPRRIGRRRAAYMAISGLDIDAATALRWGLVDAVEP